MENNQFDQFFKDALGNSTAPVPSHIWQNIITDSKFKDSLEDVKAPVSEAVWDAIEFDEVARQKLSSWHAHVPADMWTRIVGERRRRRAALWQVSAIAVVFAIMFTGLLGHKFTSRTIMSWLKKTNSNGSYSASQLPSSQKGGILKIDSSVDQSGKNNVIGSYNAGAMATTIGAANLFSQPPNRQASNSRAANSFDVANTEEQTNHYYTGPVASTQAIEPQNYSPIGEISSVTNRENWTNLQYQPLVSPPAFATDAHIRLKPIGGNIIDCPSVSSRPHKEWAIEAWAGPHYGLAAHGSQNGSTDFVRRFDSATSAAVTFSGGFRVSKYLGSGLYAKAGVQLTQLAQKFAYQSENERKTVTIITVRNVVRGPGDTVRITDTSSFIQVGYANYRSRNLIRSIDIPLTLTYNVLNNERFTVGVTTGVIVNLQTWYNGTVFDKNMRTVHIGEELGYKNNLGIAFIAGLHLAKPISERWGLFAEPYFRYNMQGLTAPSSPYKQHYHQVGMQVGLKWKLNNKSSNY